MQQHLSLLKTQAAAAASMVAQVQEKKTRSGHEDIKVVSGEREEPDSNMSSSALNCPVAHQVLSDLNIIMEEKVL